MQAAVSLPERTDTGMCTYASHITVYWKSVWKAAFSKVQSSLHKCPISRRKRGWLFLAGVMWSSCWQTLYYSACSKRWKSVCQVWWCDFQHLSIKNNLHNNIISDILVLSLGTSQLLEYCIRRLKWHWNWTVGRGWAITKWNARLCI